MCIATRDSTVYARCFDWYGEGIVGYFKEKSFDEIPEGKAVRVKLDSFLVIHIARVAGEVIRLIRFKEMDLLGSGSFFRAKQVFLVDDKGEFKGCRALLKPKIKQRVEQEKQEDLQLCKTGQALDESMAESKAYWSAHFEKEIVKRTEWAKEKFGDCSSIHVRESRLINEKGGAFIIAPLAVCSGKSPQNPANLLPMFKQLAGALAVIHERGFLSGDIKPANCLFFEDLGWTLADNVFLQAKERHDLSQTIFYISPEHAAFLCDRVGFDQRSMGLERLYFNFEDAEALKYEIKGSDEIFSLGYLFLECYYLSLEKGLSEEHREVVAGIAPMIERMTGVDIRLFDTFRDVVNAIDPKEKGFIDLRLGASYSDSSRRPSAAEVASAW